MLESGLLLSGARKGFGWQPNQLYCWLYLLETDRRLVNEALLLVELFTALDIFWNQGEELVVYY